MEPRPDDPVRGGLIAKRADRRRCGSDAATLGRGVLLRLIVAPPTCYFLALIGCPASCPPSDNGVSPPSSATVFNEPGSQTARDTCSLQCPRGWLNAPNKYRVEEHCAALPNADAYGNPLCTGHCSVARTCSTSGVCTKSTDVLTTCVCSKESPQPPNPGGLITYCDQCYPTVTQNLSEYCPIDPPTDTGSTDDPPTGNEPGCVPESGWHGSPKPSGSWDWNCDGKVEREFAVVSFRYASVRNAYSCSPKYDGQFCRVERSVINNRATCNQGNASNLGQFYLPCDRNDPCGGEILVQQCWFSDRELGCKPGANNVVVQRCR